MNLHCAVISYYINPLMNQIIIQFSNLEIQDLPMNQKIHFLVF